MKNSKTTHGKSYSRAYNIWAMMRQRCTNPKAANYLNYGGRGITCCDEWRQFSQFYKDMGEPPSTKHTLDRVDNSKGYSPANCRWADVETQQNNRTNANNIQAFGQTLSVAQWARKTGLSRDMITHRIFVMGMPSEDALKAEKMSWVQRRVVCRSLDGSNERVFDSLATAGKAVGVRRESLWAALKRSSPAIFSGYSWEYVDQEA